MKRNVLVIAVAAASMAAGIAIGILAARPSGAGVAGQAGGERKVLFYRDPMNPARTSPEPRKDDMGMDYVPVYEGAEGGRPAASPGAVYVDPRMSQSSGVRTEEVRVRRLTKRIRTVGQVTYDERRLHDLNSKVQGWIETLFVDYTGKPVRRGDPLMAIYSPELVSTQQEYLLAVRGRDALPAGSSLRQEAEALVLASRQRLRYFDIPNGEIRELERRGAPTKTLTVRSPIDGYVVEKAIVQGARVTPGMPLFKIADLSTVWVLADVYEYELPWVATGQPATIDLPYAPGAPIEGRVTYVYPYLAGETRTVKVRIEVGQGAGPLRLKPDMFATVTIRSPIVREAVAVPEQAVLRTGERSVGIVALGRGWFEPRDLKLGVTADGYVEVIAGVRAGEQLVTSSQFLIDSESNLRSSVSAMGAHEGHGAKPSQTSAASSPSVQPPSRGGREVEARKPPPREADHGGQEAR